MFHDVINNGGFVIAETNSDVLGRCFLVADHAKMAAGPARGECADALLRTKRTECQDAGHTQAMRAQQAPDHLPLTRIATDSELMVYPCE